MPIQPREVPRHADGRPRDPRTVEGSPFERAAVMMATLRHPDGGCPWDLAQTHASLRPYAIEETYEMVEAVDGGDDAKLCEELGDVLLQVLFHAQIASERGAFTVDDVCARLVEKLVRRHPHVWGDVAVDDAAHVLRNWEQIKQAERRDEHASTGDVSARPKGVLSGVPRELPALLQAMRIQEKAARVGFDWPDMSGVEAKVREEFDELREAVETGETARITHEYGDLLFASVNWAMRHRVDPEMALRETIERFRRRFAPIESALAESRTLTLDEMESLYQHAKQAEVVTGVQPPQG